jgi:hypothetical protein
MVNVQYPSKVGAIVTYTLAVICFTVSWMLGDGMFGPGYELGFIAAALIFASAAIYAYHHRTDLGTPDWVAFPIYLVNVMAGSLFLAAPYDDGLSLFLDGLWFVDMTDAVSAVLLAAIALGLTRVFCYAAAR